MSYPCVVCDFLVRQCPHEVLSPTSWLSSPTSPFSTRHKHEIETPQTRTGSAVVQRDGGSGRTAHEHLAFPPGAGDFGEMVEMTKFHFPYLPAICPLLKWWVRLCPRSGPIAFKGISKATARLCNELSVCSLRFLVRQCAHEVLSPTSWPQSPTSPFSTRHKHEIEPLQAGAGSAVVQRDGGRARTAHKHLAFAPGAWDIGKIVEMTKFLIPYLPAICPLLQWWASLCPRRSFQRSFSLQRHC